jgi:hypothetical protein
MKGASDGTWSDVFPLQIEDLFESCRHSPIASADNAERLGLRNASLKRRSNSLTHGLEFDPVEDLLEEAAHD